jgi:hypothetical protein|tara:strand:+ start:92 stop:271 length:180 start_codon:yes stop_codon:yes gene_type:complete
MAMKKKGYRNGGKVKKMSKGGSAGGRMRMMKKGGAVGGKKSLAAAKAALPKGYKIVKTK